MLIQLGPASDAPVHVDHYEELRDGEIGGDYQLVRSVAAARWPTPRVSFVIFALLAGTVWYLESVKKPSLAESSNLPTIVLEPESRLHHWAPLIALGLFFILVLGLWIQGLHALGALVRSYIQKADRRLFGTDVTLEKVSFHLCGMKFKLRKLVVKNPEPFKADHLLSVEDVTVIVNLRKLLASRGTEIEVENLTLHKVDAVLEYDNSGRCSNLQTVLGRMTVTQQLPTNIFADEKKMSPQRVSVKKVDITDVGGMQHTKLYDVRTVIGEIHYQNFTEETGGSTDIDDIVCTLFKSLGETIVANMMS